MTIPSGVFSASDWLFVVRHEASGVETPTAYIFTVNHSATSSKTNYDFNGDGKADVLWRNTITGEVYMWLMNGMSISSQGSVATVSDLNWKTQLLFVP
ncbi:MAG: VCBS repeat-containing protein [Deltaproteobacteria bacterium]|nr:VCBS repeat-containing protein [Deltaproteobacteria bacterium]